MQEDAAHVKALLRQVRHFEVLRQRAELARVGLAHRDAQLVAARRQLDVAGIAKAIIHCAFVLIGCQGDVDRLATAINIDQ